MTQRFNIFTAAPEGAKATIAETVAPDADYALLQTQFDEREQGFLSLLIGTINSWNRIQLGFRGAHPADVAPLQQKVFA